MSKVAVIGIIGNSVFLPVEKFHEGGETVEAQSIHFEPGGKGFNQAVAAARGGAEVSFLAAVGLEYRKDFSDLLDKENIRHTLVSKDGSTAFAAIVTDRSGSNRVTVYQGVSLTAEDVFLFEAEIRKADILLLNNEVPEEVNIAAIKIAEKSGARCILNPAPARKASPFILDRIELFTPNEHETLGIEDKENVIVTLGKRGCLIKSTNSIIPAASYGEAVDTTGAGDTFNGTLAAMLADGYGVAAAARIANRTAALGVTRKFAVSSIPTHGEILKIIKETEKELCKRD